MIDYLDIFGTIAFEVIATCSIIVDVACTIIECTETVFVKMSWTASHARTDLYDSSETHAHVVLHPS